MSPRLSRSGSFKPRRVSLSGCVIDVAENRRRLAALLTGARRSIARFCFERKKTTRREGEGKRHRIASYRYHVGLSVPFCDEITHLVRAVRRARFTCSHVAAHSRVTVHGGDSVKLPPIGTSPLCPSSLRFFREIYAYHVHSHGRTSAHEHIGTLHTRHGNSLATLYTRM